jgi:hypothetical protein
MFVAMYGAEFVWLRENGVAPRGPVVNVRRTNMNRKYRCSGALLAVGLGLLGCEHDSRVEHEIDDLKKAQQDSPKVAKELEEELAEAKAEVVRLEEKLALARQGVTTDVLEERKELKDALNSQTRDVKEEINEAQRAANEHNVESQVAQEQLKRAQPTEHVKAQVHTETQVTPAKTEVELKSEETSIPVQTNRVVERTTETPIDQAEIERRRAAQRERSAELPR